MNQRALRAIKTESGRRCSAEDLKTILANTPIILGYEKGSKFTAHMGLGKIIYIQPIKGKIIDVKLGQDVKKYYKSSNERTEVIEYNGLRYEINHYPK